MLAWFSNLLNKAVIVSEETPLPVVATTSTPTFDFGKPISENNPLPVVVVAS